jgi:hypothetical protein
VFTVFALAAVVPAPGAGKKPNILVIWGDDIDQSNISAYTFGLVGYQTPNVDRVAREGMMFTDYYGEQSCTAGRSAFIIGQSGSMGSDSIDLSASQIIHRFAVTTACLWRSLAVNEVFDPSPETVIAQHPGFVGRLAYGLQRLIADGLVEQSAIAATSFLVIRSQPAVQRMFTNQYIRLTQRIAPIT